MPPTQQPAPTDSQMLDWLAAHPRLAEFKANDGTVTDCYYYAVAGAPGLTLRELIAAAMNGGGL